MTYYEKQREIKQVHQLLDLLMCSIDNSNITDQAENAHSELYLRIERYIDQISELEDQLEEKEKQYEDAVYDLQNQIQDLEHELAPLRLLMI